MKLNPIVLRLNIVFVEKVLSMLTSSIIRRGSLSCEDLCNIFLKEFAVLKRLWAFWCCIYDINKTTGMFRSIK
jgi:hypothetical protein